MRDFPQRISLPPDREDWCDPAGLIRKSCRYDETPPQQCASP